MKLTTYKPQAGKDSWSEGEAQSIALLCSYMVNDRCRIEPMFLFVYF